jgi:hypothetical protein
LVEGKQPSFGPIYTLSENQLETLYKYLRENEEKGYIRKSQSLVGYPILFVPKPNGEL